MILPWSQGQPHKDLPERKQLAFVQPLWFLSTKAKAPAFWQTPSLEVLVRQKKNACCDLFFGVGYWKVSCQEFHILPLRLSSLWENLQPCYGLLRKAYNMECSSTSYWGSLEKHPWVLQRPRAWSEGTWDVEAKDQIRILWLPGKETSS